MRKVFLEDLPRKNRINNIDWSLSIGHCIKFIYDDIKGYIEIIDYKSGTNPIIKILYNNIESEIYISNFQKGQLARILDKQSSNFKIEVGTDFKDNKRDIIITDREYRQDKNGRSRKCYKYTCNVCGWTEGWNEENNLLNGKQGCSCCRGLTVVEGINDIPTTAPELVKYFHGGYDEAKLYTTQSGHKIIPICPQCGRIKDKPIKICNIFNQRTIGCSCSDSISFGEKVTNNILKQLEINFQTQLSKITFNWCNKYKYDFYFKLNNEQYICEVNGIQHYEDAWDKLEVTQENDRLKKELALLNGIKEKNYIVIDCRYSKLGWIKDNDNGILNSRLNELFDLSKIDWNEVQEFSLSNLVKRVCEIKRNNPELSTTEIGKAMGYYSSTICNWLKQGNGIWCDYNPKEEKEKSFKKSIKTNSKQVEIFKNGISLGIFKSGREIARLSEELFGVKIANNAISAVCLGKQNTSKGYTFKYTEELKEVANF